MIYAIDGNNVVFWQKNVPGNPPSLRPLFRIINTIIIHEASFYCVFDASIANVLKESCDEREIDILEEILSVYPDNFFRVTASTTADSVICEFANRGQCGIITNDRYRDLIYRYNWLEDRYTSRLIQGNLQPNGIISIQKLPYAAITEDTGLENLFQIFKNNMTRAVRGVDVATGDVRGDSNQNRYDLSHNPQRFYVQKARAMLQDFLQQYGSSVVFDGFVWDAATRSFRNFFMKTRYAPVAGRFRR